VTYSAEIYLGATLSKSSRVEHRFSGAQTNIVKMCHPDREL